MAKKKVKQKSPSPKKIMTEVFRQTLKLGITSGFKKKFAARKDVQEQISERSGVLAKKIADDIEKAGGFKKDLPESQIKRIIQKSLKEEKCK